MSLHVERSGHALVLTIDRPEVKNAIDRDVAKKIGDAIDATAEDRDVRGVVITAAGSDTFSAGGDLREIARAAASATREDGAEMVLAMGDDLAKIEACDVPVVAAVQGSVFGGGCELVALCDLVIAEPHATFAFRHAKMGLSPAWGGLTRLIERVGPLEAARMLYTAASVGAEEAARIGLVNEVVAAGQAKSRALELVAAIAKNPRASVASLKRAVTEVRRERRGAAMEKERAAFVARWAGEDHLSAMASFAARSR